MLIPEIPKEIQELSNDDFDNSYLIDEERLNLLPDYKSEDLYIENLEDDKKFNNFIRKVEQLARSSPELRRFIRYLAEELNMDSCTLLNNVNSTNSKIEMHHYPFTLYDLVDIIIRKRQAMGRSFSTLDLAHELVEIHYLKLVGLVPLSKTVHELAHSGKVFISLKHVFGNVKEFIRKYRLGLTPDYIEKLKLLIQLSESDSAENLNKETLRLNPKIWMSETANFGNMYTLASQEGSKAITFSDE